MANQLKVDALNNQTRYTCPDCGRWEYAGKAIRHSKRCDCNEQPPEVLEKAERNRLLSFAQTVKRTGMAKGRSDDLAAAVKLGYLSQSDAMNLDD